ncbi:signal peptidase II [Proteiniclasticum sp. BAD-10]|uniref:Lipoprotein signal peptidase n=1 Tax=Proteiniclasticum sediminis TaxID=2804028 RepID=A0A941CPT8_9CLOT|nr:signal peptidase II [Proteiniclasticum sediminis]MBR0575419.1 signal peptidase II [Proteiniclasticum sediminis]
MIYIIFLIGMALDILTKQWAMNGLKPQGDITVIPGFFDLAYLENRGAAFGIFQGKVVLLVLVTFVVLSILFLNYLKTPKKSLLFTWSNALILTGALGNLLDRVRLGYVVDFLSLHYKNQYYFPTFNVADICITFGTGLLILYILKEVE